MPVYEPDTITIYIHATNIKLRSKRTLSSKCFDVLVDTVIALPHSTNIFFWKRQTSCFLRFTVYSKCDLSAVLNLLVLLSNLNPSKGNIECFTDDKIIYRNE